MITDLVHDVQAAYRKLIGSMSRPGTISDIRYEAKIINNDTESFSSTSMLALMLLNREATFSVLPSCAEKAAEWIGNQTRAKWVKPEKADFLFVLASAEKAEVEEAIALAKAGTLGNPYDSAVLILETDYLSLGKEVNLTESDDKEERLIRVSNADLWMDSREEKNKERSLGIDFILADSFGYILYLPKNVKVREAAAV